MLCTVGIFMPTGNLRDINHQPCACLCLAWLLPKTTWPPQGYPEGPETCFHSIHLQEVPGDNWGEGATFPFHLPLPQSGVSEQSPLPLRFLFLTLSLCPRFYLHRFLSLCFFLSRVFFSVLLGRLGAMLGVNDFVKLTLHLFPIKQT